MRPYSTEVNDENTIRHPVYPRLVGERSEGSIAYISLFKTSGMLGSNDFFFFRKPAGIASSRGKELCFLTLLGEGEAETDKGIGDFPHLVDAFDELRVMQGLKMEQYTLAQKQLIEEFSPGEEYGLLNRLDTDTSGLLYFARSRDLYMQFRDLQHAGKVEKYYFAQVRGDVVRNVNKNIGIDEKNIYITYGSPRGVYPAPSWARDDGAVEKYNHDIILRFPIMHHRHDDDRMVSCLTSAGLEKLARQGRGKVLEIESIVTPLSYDPVSNTSIVRVMIHQGVRHQIRVHLATLGNPIIGDGLYGEKKDAGYASVLQLVSAGARIVR